MIDKIYRHCDYCKYLTLDNEYICKRLCTLRNNIKYFKCRYLTNIHIETEKEFRIRMIIQRPDLRILYE